MKGFLIAVVLIAAMVVGAGFYLGWWSVSAGTADNTVGVSLTVDKDKIGADAHEVQP